MRSGWFWNTPMWEAYQVEYWKGRVRPEEYKTSPLGTDHDFLFDNFGLSAQLEYAEHQTQVVDLKPPLDELWRGVRASYHALIHRAEERYRIAWAHDCPFEIYQGVHTAANGRQPRPDATYDIQEQWLDDGYGLLVGALGARDCDDGTDRDYCAFSYWIIYQGCAYYASGPSIARNVQHAVIWHSLGLLKSMGIRLVELGQIDGATEKEQNIGRFKQGFGGQAVPFTIARRTA